MREQLMIVKIDICCFGYAFGVPRLAGHSGVNICGGLERSPTNNKGGGHPNAQTILTPMNMQHTNI